MSKTENRGGSRVANPDYKKVRRDVFSMVEQLVESNTILTQSLQHNEKLQRKCLARIKDMRANIDDLEIKLSGADATAFILKDKIKHQDDIIIELNNDICDAAEKSSHFPKEVN